jgi:copper(I)-binding protein
MHALMAMLLACGSPEPTRHEEPHAEAPTEVAPSSEGAAPMAAQITVTDARARAMPPGTPNSGAFMTFHNGGSAEARVVAGKADVSATVELHTHVMEDGMMKMRQIPEIVLPPGEDVALQPGGLHVMFIGLTGPLEEGSSFPLTLEFADGSSTVVDVPVKAIAPPKH